MAAARHTTTETATNKKQLNQLGLIANHEEYGLDLLAQYFDLKNFVFQRTPNSQKKAPHLLEGLSIQIIVTSNLFLCSI
jgi:hypothetical protein